MSTFLVNGVDVASYATRITTAEGTQGTPDPALELIELFGHDGAYDPYAAGRLRPPDGSNSITFNMWLKGVDPETGQVAAGNTTMDLYYREWDELVRMFHRRRLVIDYVGPVGTRRTTARLTAGMKPSRDPTSPWFGRFVAACIIPGAHWFDTATVSTGGVSLTTGGTLSLDAFTGATAPITDCRVRFGPSSFPRLTNSTGGYVQYNGVVAAGRQIEFVSATGRVTSGTGTSWTPNPGNDAVTWAPGPRWFEVDPSEPLTATFTHTGGGAVNIEVIGTRRYRSSGGG